jgi:hypothetical protein
MLYNVTLRDFVPLAADGMNNVKLVTQTTRLESVSGRIDHRKGEHDDAVIGWLLAGWFILHARNKDYYAIDNDMILRSVREREMANMDHASMAIHSQNAKYIELIEKKLEELKVCQDDYTSRAIEDNIRYLESQLNNTLEGSKPLNVDDLLSKAKQEADTLNSYSYTDNINRRGGYNPYNNFF